MARSQPGLGTIGRSEFWMSLDFFKYHVKPLFSFGDVDS